MKFTVPIVPAISAQARLLCACQHGLPPHVGLLARYPLQVQFTRVDLLSSSTAAAARARMIIPSGYVDSTEDVYANRFFERCGVATSGHVSSSSTGQHEQQEIDDAELLASLDRTHADVSASGPASDGLDIDED